MNNKILKIVFGLCCIVYVFPVSTYHAQEKQNIRYEVMKQEAIMKNANQLIKGPAIIELVGQSRGILLTLFVVVAG